MNNTVVAGEPLLTFSQWVKYLKDGALKVEKEIGYYDDFDIVVSVVNPFTSEKEDVSRTYHY